MDRYSWENALICVPVILGMCAKLCMIFVIISVRIIFKILCDIFSKNHITSLMSPFQYSDFWFIPFAMS